MTSNIPTDDPMDGIDAKDLLGWTKRDSSRMCSTNQGKQLGGSSSSEHSNSWVSLGDD